MREIQKQQNKERKATTSETYFCDAYASSSSKNLFIQRMLTVPLMHLVRLQCCIEYLK